MKSPVFQGQFTGPVEVDETYVGGPEHRVPFERRKPGDKTGWSNKTGVVSLIDRKTGEKRSVVMERVTAANLGAAIAEHVAPGATINTDESRKYRKISKGYTRRPVNHSRKEYARKENGEPVSVNYCESSFSLLKRGIMGSFHHVSKKHLGRYMAEFDYKWNTRKGTDGARTVESLKNSVGKRLTYKPLTKKD